MALRALGGVGLPDVGLAAALLDRRAKPTSEEERNFILETRVRHHLTCNGYIEPELVAEVATAWGAR